MRLDLPSVRSIGPADQSRGLLAEWRVGAILQAVAVRDGRSGELWLNIGNLRYPARLASGNGAGPSDGEVLTLRVLRNSPVLALETLQTTASRSTAEDSVTSDALRRHVPRQASPAPLLSNLAWLARGDGGTDSLPNPVVQAVGRLWQALPDVAALTDPKGLQNAIARSGTFLEAALAGSDARATSAAVATDLKALMLDLSRVLREQGARPSAALADSSSLAPMPGARGPLTSLPAAPATLAVLDVPTQQLNELARQTDGALSRLTTLQITNTPQDAAAVQSMLLEIPVRHEDRAAMIRLRIERDRSRKSESTAESWTVEAAMDLGAIGALHARVTLLGHRIGVQLRAESAGVVETLSARAPELESMLREAGLQVDRIVCLHGMPAGEAGTRLSRLLDVRA
jgi:hypothetical protein